MNPLDHYPGARRIAYIVQFVVAGAILLVGIGYGAADASLPQWYVVTAAVANGAWAYLGLTAAQNVPSYKDVVEGDAPPPDDAVPGAHADRGAVDVGTAVLVAILVVVLLIFLGVGFDAR